MKLLVDAIADSIIRFSYLLITPQLNQSIPLFIVENTFTISGKGLVLCPGPIEIVPFFQTGASLQLVLPNGQILHTTIKGIQFQSPHNVIVEAALTKTDVPVGTKVWLQA